MLILLNKSELFTNDPDKRFSVTYKVPQGIWKEMWRRYSILDYSRKDLAEYFELKTKKKISNQNIKRWIYRTKIFIKIKPVMDRGCESVNSYFFEELEWFVLKELLKNLRSSVNKNPKIMP